MSGNRNSGNRSGRTSIADRQKTIAPRSPAEKAAKQARDEVPLTECPAPPISPLFDDRAEEIWARLGNHLVAHGMLSELDLATLEWVVIAWRSTELNAGSKAATVPANAVRVISGLKSLGLTKDGRVTAAAEEEAAVDESPFTGLFAINGGKATKPKQSRNTG